MITQLGSKGVCRAKLSQFLRYYENLHGVQLSAEMVEEEAAKSGCEIDYDGEDPVFVARPPVARRNEKPAA
ncbi:MAG TPA: hypothetical protein VLW06_02160 [Terriglobales bacterium]|nr:hypothetical protein [Terriglobales bacterium]